MDLSALIRISVEHRGGIPVLAVGGEIDMLTAPALQKALDDLIGERPTPLIIDLSAVTFVGSAALAALVSARERLGDDAGFAVVATGVATSRVIQLAHLDEAFSLCATLEEALTCVCKS